MSPAEVAGVGPGRTEGLRERAVRGAAWNALEKWSVRASTLVGFIILGNLLSPHQFGVVSLASTFISILTLLSDAGFAAYLLRMKEVDRAALSTAFWTSSALAAAFAGALALAAPALADALRAPQLASVLPALAASLLISGVSGVPTMLLRRELRFRELALRQVSATVLSVVTAVVLAFAGAGVWALVAQTLVRSAVAGTVLWLATGFRPRWEYDRVHARAMTRYGALSMGAALATQLRSQGEVFLIGALSGTVAVGFWTVAGRIVSVVVEVLTSVFRSVGVPVFARVQDDPERLARAFGAASSLSALIVVPALLGLSLLSGELVPLLFGAKWAFAATLASVVAVRQLLGVLTTTNGNVLLATGHPGAEVAINSTTLVVQLGWVVLLHEHLVLLAGVLSITTALTIPVRALLVRRLVGIPLSAARSTAGVVAAAALSAAAVLVVQVTAHPSGAWRVVLVVLVGGALYVAGVLVLARPAVLQMLRSTRPLLTGPRTPRALRGLLTRLPG